MAERAFAHGAMQQKDGQSTLWGDPGERFARAGSIPRATLPRAPFLRLAGFEVVLIGITGVRVFWAPVVRGASPDLAAFCLDVEPDSGLDDGSRKGPGEEPGRRHEAAKAHVPDLLVRGPGKEHRVRRIELLEHGAVTH